MQRLLSLMVFLFFITIGVSYAEDASKLSYSEMLKSFLLNYDNYYVGKVDDPKNLATLTKFYQKYLSAAELKELYDMHKSPTHLKLKSNRPEIIKLEDDYFAKNNNPLSKSTAKKTAKKSTINPCDTEIKYIIKDVTEGLQRYPRICDVNESPSSLDKAYDGNAAADNPLFTRITTYPRTLDWVKKGNEYTYTCYSDPKFKKTFVYDPKKGSFNIK